MRNFGGSERMTRIMDRFGMEEGEAVENRLMNKVIEGAQKRVEQRNYIWRKHVLDYDDVMNQQRTIVYAMRNDALLCEEPRIMIYEILEEIVRTKCDDTIADEHDGTVHAANLLHWVNTTFPIGWNDTDSPLEGKTASEAAEIICARVKELYEKKISGERPDYVDRTERSLMLQAIDKMWQRHINDMDALREGVRLRAQGQRDPLVEYKREAYGLFETLMREIQLEVVSMLFRSTTDLSAFEDFLASLPPVDNVEDPEGAALLGNQDLLTALREQMRMLHEQGQPHGVPDSEDTVASGDLPVGVTMTEEKVSLPRGKKKIVSIGPGRKTNPATDKQSSVYSPDDATPTL